MDYSTDFGFREDRFFSFVRTISMGPFDGRVRLVVMFCIGVPRKSTLKGLELYLPIVRIPRECCHEESDR